MAYSSHRMEMQPQEFGVNPDTNTIDAPQSHEVFDIDQVGTQNQESFAESSENGDSVVDQSEDPIAEKQERIDRISSSITETEVKVMQVREKLGMENDTKKINETPSIVRAREIQDSLQGPRINEQRTQGNISASAEKITNKDDIPQADYIDSDPRLKEVEGELIADWEKIYGSRYDRQGIQKAEFQDFMYGTPQKPKSLGDRTKEAFAVRFPQTAKEYDSREKTRVYDNPKDDPAIKKFEKDMTFSTNENLKGLSDRAYTENRAGISKTQELRSIKEFIGKYPGKSIAYGQKPGFEFFVDFMAAEERIKRRNTTLERYVSEEETNQTVDDSSIERQAIVSKEDMKHELVKEIGSIESNPINEEERARMLEQSPIIDHSAFDSIESSADRDTSFEWVNLDNVVGRPMIDGTENPSWSYEYKNRQGRIGEISEQVSKINTDESEIEHIFHYDTPTERIKVLEIDGPKGPLYSVKDGTHRVAGLKFSGLSKIPAEVFKVKYPITHEVYDEDTVYEWQKLIDKGLIQGSIEQSVDQSGKTKYSIKIEKEVLSWIRSSQNNLIRISKLYERIYPGALDNLPIPKEALLDPVANNYFMAGRFEEWKSLNDKRR